MLRQSVIDQLRPSALTAHYHAPVRLSDSGWQWWVDRPSTLAVAQLMDRYLRGDDADVELVRQKKSRSIYRLTLMAGTFFAKRGDIRAFRKRLGAWSGLQHSVTGFDHGTAEVINTLTLCHRTGVGLPPVCLGERLEGHLPTSQVIIQPWLDHGQTLQQAWVQRDDSGRAELLSELQRLVHGLYAARLSHLDFNADNIMLGLAPGTDRLQVIDCARMALDVARPDYAAALHIGKVLRSLFGRSPETFENVQMLGRDMLAATLEAPVSSELEGIMTLTLRYRLSKTGRIRRLVTGGYERIDLADMERRARKSYKNRIPLQDEATVLAAASGIHCRDQAHAGRRHSL